MKRIMLTAFTLSLIICSLTQAGVEPSPFTPEVNQLYAIDNQLQNVARRVDYKLSRRFDDNSLFPSLNGVVNSIVAINKKLINLDNRQSSIITDVLATCDPALGCPKDNTQSLADALLAVEVSADFIITGIYHFFNTHPVDSVPQEIIGAVNQVLQTAQRMADKARFYNGIFSFPTRTTYCHGEFNRIIIESGDNADTYKIVFAILDQNPQPATGLRDGDTLTLYATVQGFNLSYEFTYLNNDQNIAGEIQIEREGQFFIFNEWGEKGACPIVDIESDGVPHFIGSDFINLAQIQDISLFRSAAGHDYSDGFETCRSMKHYFSPLPALGFNNIVSIYSPVAGRIVHLDTEEEDFSDDGLTNQKVIIQPDDQPALRIILFHVDLLDQNLVVGSHLSAGQQIGYGRLIRNGGPPSHDFDIAIDANTKDGIRYISYFDTMTDSLFSNYEIWGSGPALWDGFIISESERDADLLTCSDGVFTSYGSLPSWYYELP